MEKYIHWTPTTHTQHEDFWTQACTHPQQSRGWSNDFSERLVPLQPRCINILWGDPGWVVHAYDQDSPSVQISPRSFLTSCTQAPHISTRTTISHCSCIDTHPNNIYTNEQTIQVSLSVVVQTKYSQVQIKPQKSMCTASTNHWLCRLCPHSQTSVLKLLMKGPWQIQRTWMCSRR